MLPTQKEVLLVVSGDLRIAANQQCWAEQERAEALFVDAMKKIGWNVKRGTSL